MNGGRIKFNLTGVTKGWLNGKGVPAVTEMELMKVLSLKLDSVTDFYLNGRQLVGDELAAALAPWR